MRRRWIVIIALVAIVVAAGATVGVVAARAQGESSLAATTPAQLLSDMSQHAGKAVSVSGSISWTNDVLGLSMLSFAGQGNGDLTALLSNGKGRVWVEDGKVRVEIQGSTADTTVIGDSTGVWVYQAASNTATQYTLPAQPTDQTGGSTGTTAQSSTTSATSVTDPVATIEGFIQKLAPNATVTLGAPVKVAGQTCYLLSLTPTATNTVFGSVQIAVDSTTYLPLRIEVYAKGDTKPVLSAGFTSVSYDALDAGIFAFTPPSTATVEHKTLSMPSLPGSGTTNDKNTTDATGSDSNTTGAEKAPLTLGEAAAQAGFTPLAVQSSDPALAFAGAYVIPAQNVDLQSLLSQLQSAGLGSGLFGSGANEASTSTTSGASAPATPSLPSGPVTVGPAVIQLYGQGFGTVILTEAKVPADLAAQLQQTLASIPLISRTTAGTVTIYQVTTALGSVALWDKDGVLFAAAGSVSATQLQDFIANVR